jgi:hypothetical protein
MADIAVVVVAALQQIGLYDGAILTKNTCQAITITNISTYKAATARSRHGPSRQHHCE